MKWFISVIVWFSESHESFHKLKPRWPGTELSSYWPVQCRTCPWLSTMMRSEARTVWRRWAMVKVVQSWNELLMVSWIRPSVSASIAAVASSRIRTWRPEQPIRGQNTDLSVSHLSVSDLSVFMTCLSLRSVPLWIMLHWFMWTRCWRRSLWGRRLINILGLIIHLLMIQWWRPGASTWTSGSKDDNDYVTIIYVN